MTATTSNAATNNVGTAKRLPSSKKAAPIVNPYLRKAVSGSGKQPVPATFRSAASATTPAKAPRPNIKNNKHAVARKVMVTSTKSGSPTMTSANRMSTSNPPAVASKSKSTSGKPVTPSPRLKQSSISANSPSSSFYSKSKQPSLRQKLSKEIAALKRAKQDKLRAMESKKRREERERKMKQIEEERQRKLEQIALEKQRKEAERQRKAEEKEAERQRKEAEKIKRAQEKEAERQRKEAERQRKEEERQRKEAERQRLLQERMEKERLQREAAERLRQEQLRLLQQQQQHFYQQQMQYTAAAQNHNHHQYAYSGGGGIVQGQAVACTQWAVPTQVSHQQPLSGGAGHVPMAPQTAASVAVPCSQEQQHPQQQTPSSSFTNGFVPPTAPVLTNTMTVWPPGLAATTADSMEPLPLCTATSTLSGQDLLPLTEPSQAATVPTPLSAVASNNTEATNSIIETVGALSTSTTFNHLSATESQQLSAGSHSVLPFPTTTTTTTNEQPLSFGTTNQAAAMENNTNKFGGVLGADGTSRKNIGGGPSTSLPPYNQLTTAMTTTTTTDWNQQHSLPPPPATAVWNQPGQNNFPTATNPSQAWTAPHAGVLQNMPSQKPQPPYPSYAHLPHIPSSFEGLTSATMTPANTMSTPAFFPQAFLQQPMMMMPYSSTMMKSLLPKVPRRPRAPNKIETPKVLCAPTEAPSPFMKTYDTISLLTVILIRRPDDKTFGVNLKSFQQSTLVDPDYKPPLLVKKKADVAENTEKIEAKTSQTCDAPSKILASSSSDSCQMTTPELVASTAETTPPTDTAIKPEIVKSASTSSVIANLTPPVAATGAHYQEDKQVKMTSGSASTVAPTVPTTTTQEMPVPDFVPSSPTPISERLVEEGMASAKTTILEPTLETSENSLSNTTVTPTVVASSSEGLVVAEQPAEDAMMANNLFIGNQPSCAQSSENPQDAMPLQSLESTDETTHKDVDGEKKDCKVAPPTVKAIVSTTSTNTAPTGRQGSQDCVTLRDEPNDVLMSSTTPTTNTTSSPIISLEMDGTKDVQEKAAENVAGTSRNVGETKTLPEQDGSGISPKLKGGDGTPQPPSPSPKMQTPPQAPFHPPPEATGKATAVHGETGTETAAVAGPKGAIVSVPPNPRRRRRRRVNFMVMMVVGADSQNERHKTEESGGLTLLQPEDIVVSIGGQAIAGMTFAESCGVFSKNATTCEETGETRVEVKVARRKPKEVKKSAKVVSKPVVAKTIVPSVASPPATSSKAPIKSISSKPVIVPKKQMPVLALPNNSTTFSTTELALLAESMMKAIHSSNRLLGQSISEDVLKLATHAFRKVAILKEYSGLTHRTVPLLQQKWSKLTRALDADLNRVAKEYWNKALAEECNKDVGALPFSTDAKRSALRRLPRPVTGCRCGASDHSYLHDPKCTLYRDLRRLVPKDVLATLEFKAQAKQKDTKQLNTVQTAFKDRIVKMKTTAEMEEAEARFVAHMEEVQVQQCKKAIFAPNLTSMVLSAVFELQRDFPIRRDRMQDPTDDSDDEGDDQSEDDDDHEEDASKRKSSSSSGKRKKKRKVKGEANISFKYVMKMLEHISKTWGHVYREPSHEEYAWRWEIFHGHHSEQAQWESHSKNPRRPNRLTFENVRFGKMPSMAGCDKLSELVSDFEMAVLASADKMAASFNEETVSTTKNSPSSKDTTVEKVSKETADANPDLKKTMDSEKRIEKENDDQDTKIDIEKKETAIPMEIDEPEISEKKTEEPPPKRVLAVSQQQVDTYSLAAHRLSPASSGVYDELLALLKLGVLHASTDGIPYLAPEWASKVDVVVLDDMDAAWGTDVDPDGRHCVHFELRDALEEEWVKSGFGWAIAEDPDDIIFDVEVLQEWRQAFEGKVEEKANMLEGIGRFGL